VPRDHYQEVTDQIIAALEAGTPPWRRPWDPDKAGGPAMPRNAATGHGYRGINVLTLGMSPLAFTSGDPRWATYKQSEERGWQVRKGEHGTVGFFFRRLEVRDDKRSDDDEDAVRRIPLLRAFTLFHASQIDCIPDYVPPTIEEAPWRAPEAAEIILANSGAVVRYGGERAFYSPATDHIQMPPRGAFAAAEGFCGTLIHELGHWSGAESRLNRDLRNRFGSHDYVHMGHVNYPDCLVAAYPQGFSKLRHDGACGRRFNWRASSHEIVLHIHHDHRGPGGIDVVDFHRQGLLDCCLFRQPSSSVVRRCSDRARPTSASLSDRLDGTLRSV